MEREREKERRREGEREREYHHLHLLYEIFGGCEEVGHKFTLKQAQQSSNATCTRDVNGSG